TADQVRTWLRNEPPGVDREPSGAERTRRRRYECNGPSEKGTQPEVLLTKRPVEAALGRGAGPPEVVVQHRHDALGGAAVPQRRDLRAPDALRQPLADPLLDPL